MIQSTFDLWSRGGFDAITLQAVADRAEVSLKTVVRHFGTKEGLLTACMEVSVTREEGAREVAAGDIAGVVAVLSQRYEAMADYVVRNAEMEFRYPVMGAWVARTRASHKDWLARAFAPWLPPEGPVREQRLMALYWATEIRSWWAVRHAFGQDLATAQAVLLSLLEALVAQWGAPLSRSTP